MKKLIVSLLCLVLAMSLSMAALCEALSVEGEVPELLEPLEDSVEEVESNALLAGNDATEEQSSEEQPTEEQPAEEQPQEEAPVLGKPMKAKVLTVNQSVTYSVYLGIPYVLDVEGGIKSVRSRNEDVATVDKTGAVTLHSTGKTKITIKTPDKAKWIVTLKVLPSPAPSDLKLKISKNKASLSWTPAEHATRYLVQTSCDGENWQDLELLKKSRKSLNVTSAMQAQTWFRVAAVLGDALGGVSDPISYAFEPVTGVRVICQESKYEGPTYKMNVLWDACEDASGYEIYHATLPSEEYTLIGTTKKTWFPVTRAATQLDAYRVKPLFADADLPMSDPVTLWTGFQDNVLPPANLTSSSGIILVVNKKAQVVTAYVQDAEGEYTIPLRHMICSSGRVYGRTKNGTYALKSRKGQWYRYPSGCYIRWPSIYRSGYYFHSPLYRSNKRINTSTVNRLGTRQSLGCIRLKVLDAEWIYKNCPAGTAVYICDGGKRDSLLKAIKPKDVKVSGF